MRSSINFDDFYNQLSFFLKEDFLIKFLATVLNEVASFGHPKVETHGTSTRLTAKNNIQISRLPTLPLYKIRYECN